MVWPSGEKARRRRELSLHQDRFRSEHTVDRVKRSGDDPGAFSTEHLLVSARVYRRTSIQVVFLWGVETWLEDPAWMQAAIQSMGILRTR